MTAEGLLLMAGEALLELVIAAVKAGDAQRASELAEMAARRFAFEEIQRRRIRRRRSTP